MADGLFRIAKAIHLRMPFTVTLVPSLGNYPFAFRLSPFAIIYEHGTHHGVRRYEVLATTGNFDTMCNIICVFHKKLLTLHPI